ncbi:MAG TPA: histidinol-phosphate transaminase [Casimicrobiaceae bacterium]|nr:histidinol-phosphate transaminase [Casimicrobiaceae bacterium]
MNADQPAGARAATLAPEYVRRIAPYVPGKPIDELARDYGLAPDAIIKLASNENPRGPSRKVREAIATAAADVTRYPDGNGFELKQALAARYGIGREQIVLGNGSNDVLELATQAFLRPGDHAVYSRHAFAVYPLATQARGAIGIEVPARDYGHDLEAMAKAITADTRVVFIANPNNPTGTWLSSPAVKAFLDRVPREVVVVLDEAYDEYLDAGQRSQSVGWIAEYPNLLVSRTFSKAYGLAGVRVGFGMMDAEVADLLNRVRQPFNVNSVAQAAALAALADADYVAESAMLNRTGLRALGAALDAMGVAYIPSHGNFLLVHVGDAPTVYESLLRKGIIVRPTANYGLPEHLRVTIGLPQEVERFVAELASALHR